MAWMNDLFDEIDRHITEDDRPSEYLNRISATSAFDEYPFKMLADMKETNQSPKHHPEGNVWKHTMLVVDEAAKVKSKSRDERVFMWAALLHDIGKPGTTRYRKGRITSYDHDKLGAKLAEKFLREFSEDDFFIEKVVSLIRWHMQILFVVNDLPFADVEGMNRDADIEDIALLGLCDRLGRTGARREVEEENIEKFLKKCKAKQKLFH